MIRCLVLFVRMLRYRVALMIWTFMLLAAAHHDGLRGLSWEYAWAVLALGSSYVAATALNDVADKEIDLVNHPRDAGRPLVSGEATERDLLVLHAVASSLALLAALPLGASAVAIVASSLAVSYAYSLPPVRLSYRTYLAPAALGIAYVLIPYLLGLELAGARFGGDDLLFAAALLALFLARIILKDFRDREGDARFGKPTLLLRFGKTAACLASLAALALGNVLLLAALALPAALVVLLEVLVVTIASRLYALAVASTPRDEQVAIGIGARMGNGLLLTVLGTLILSANGARPEEIVAFGACLTGLFLLSFAALVARPEDAVIGYKG